MPSIMSKILSQPWFLPAVSILAASVFISVHLSPGTKLFSSASNNENIGGGPLTNGGGIVSFTYTPTTAPNSDLQYVPVPTVMVIGHNIPQINDLVPSASPKPQHWNIPLGEPTPDPAMLSNNGSPSPALGLNISKGEPTPDPALLPNQGTPINLGWNISKGEPTPDPALLPNQGTPINLVWNIPRGEPTPDPALLPNQGTPINLGWNIPKGEPTPDPALLPNQGTPIHLGWNIPKGEPTPDPALLPSLIGSPQVQYYPPSAVRPLEFGTSAPSINPSPSIPPLPLGKPTKSPTKKPRAPKRSPTVSPVLSPPVFRPTTSPGPSSLPYGSPPTLAPTKKSVAKPSRRPAASVVKTPSPTKGVSITDSPSSAPTLLVPSPTKLPKTNAPSAVPTLPPVTPPTPLVRPPSPWPMPVVHLPIPVPGPPMSPLLVIGGPPTQIVIQTGSGGGQGGVGGVNVDPKVVVTSGGCGSGGGVVVVHPWWNVMPTVPPTTEPVIAKHNEIFLKGCDPLQCVLNETATFYGISNEDESIYEIFYTNPIKCCRVIVEIGVGNGERHSVSKFFEDALKWRPLLIEANPDVYKELQVNRPNTTKVNGAFCESDSMTFENGNFHAIGGSVEVTSELHTLGSNSANGGANHTIPCLQMDTVFSEYGITKVDVMVIRVPGDALAYIRSMDWTVRVDIWIILMHGQSRQERDDLVRTVLSKNEYVQAEWDIKRWCADTGACLNNQVFLRKGFNPLPGEVAELQRGLRRNLRGRTGK